MTETLSYDRHGINGPSPGRERLATFTQAAKDDGRADQWGPLFAVAPEMLATLDSLLQNSDRFTEEEFLAMATLTARARGES